MRLAWFSPLPPDRSGIAAYSAEALSALPGAWMVECFVDGPPAALLPLTPARACRSAFDFPRLHGQAPYDLVVYQLGNAGCHDYMWPYLVRYPGLVVLHDAQMHHSRAASLIRRGREDDYRAEFAFCPPEAPPEVTEFVVNGLQGSPYYLWPLRRIPLAASRAVAVHCDWLARELQDEAPDTPIAVIRMGTRPHDPSRRARVVGGPVGRAATAGPTLAAFGGLTHEKRIPQVLRAFGRTLEVAPGARLILVGETRDHYDVEGDLRSLGLAGRVTVTGYVPDADLDAWLDAADVCLCLRWPTSRETSASWLRCLAAGKPTVITDLAHTIDVPSLDPRTWQVQHASTQTASVAAPPRRGDAVAVAIDILDEDHSLELALRRLAVDAELRRTLGANARAWWQRHHTLAHMAEDYVVAVELARSTPAVPTARASLPAHLTDAGLSTLNALLAETGVGAIPGFEDLVAGPVGEKGAVRNSGRSRIGNPDSRPAAS
jgi:glycosyltransferase involved in cell wall biosynthesis